jgi:hypothetical protein
MQERPPAAAGGLQRYAELNIIGITREEFGIADFRVGIYEVRAILSKGGLPTEREIPNPNS